MSVLLKTAPLFHVVAILLILGKSRRIGLLPRHRDRQQEVDRDAKCASELLVKNDSSLALLRFEVRQISLSNSDGHRQHCLRHIAPFAQHSDRIFAGRKAINNGLRQQNFTSSRHRRARLAHQAGGTDVFVGRPCRKALVFTLWQNRELLAASRLDELNLGHIVLSFIDFTAMSCGNDHKRVALDVEDNAPVADTQPRAIPAFEPFHVPLPRLRERHELCFEPSSHIGGELEPLTRGRRGPNDLHRRDIAYCDTLVKNNIAYCDEGLTR